MKIKVLHNNNARFELIRRTLMEKNNVADITGAAIPVERLPAFINGTPPDVLIIDEAGHGCLEAVETLNLRSPGVHTLLISADATAEFLMRAMRAGVREVVPLSSPPQELQAALTRLVHKSGKPGVAETEGSRVLAFISCKGGSGTTFIAANFAHVLASEFGKRVALIDLNLQFGDAAIFVSDARPPSNVAELSQQIHRLDASLLASSMLEAAPNLFVLAAPEDPVHAIDVKREHIEAIVQLARRHYDFVVLDVSRSFDAVSLQALDMADAIFPVLQLTLPFVRDGKRLLSIFHSLDLPRSKVHPIVNRHEKGGELSLQDLERAIGAKVMLTIPNSYEAAANSVNLGIPIAKASRGNPISKRLIELGHELLPTTDQAASGGWLHRMLAPPARN